MVLSPYQEVPSVRPAAIDWRRATQGEQAISVPRPLKIIKNTAKDAPAIDLAREHSFDVFHNKCSGFQPIENANVFSIKVMSLIMFRDVVSFPFVP